MTEDRAREAREAQIIGATLARNAGLAQGMGTGVSRGGKKAPAGNPAVTFIVVVVILVGTLGAMIALGR